jgi:DNA-directed RNA polymerase I, II, and III subunit RPABC1
MERAYNTCLEMLEQRNYEIINKEEDQIVALKPDGNQVIVFLSDSLKFNVKNIQMYITIMDELQIFHAIIIYKESITVFTKKAIEQSLEMTFELFAVEDLQYNITKHVLQPKFECLTTEESTKFKKQYGNRFPTLRRDDPISKFYGYNKGDVIKITRPNNYISYSIVKG